MDSRTNVEFTRYLMVHGGVQILINCRFRLRAGAHVPNG